MRKEKYTCNDVLRLAKEIWECDEITYHNRCLLNEEYATFSDCLFNGKVLSNLDRDPKYIEKYLNSKTNSNTDDSILKNEEMSFSDIKDLCLNIKTTLPSLYMKESENKNLGVMSNVRLGFDDYDLEKIQLYTGKRYDPFHIYSNEELDEIINCVKLNEDGEELEDFINEGLVKEASLAKERSHQKIDAPYQIREALINGIGKTKAIRTFNNMGEVNKYAEYILEIIQYMSRGKYGLSVISSKFAIDPEIIEEAIKVANELPVEKLKEKNPEMYNHIIASGIPSGLKKIKFDDNYKTYYGPKMGLYDIPGVSESLGSYFLNEVARRSLSKKAEEKRDIELGKLKKALNDNGSDLLEDSVSNVVQQLKYLLSMHYDYDDVLTIIDSYQKTIEQALEDGNTANDLYDYLDERIKNDPFEDKQFWQYDYINRTLKLSKEDVAYSNLHSLTFEISEKDVGDFWSYGKGKTIKKSEVTINYLMDVLTENGIIQDLVFRVYVGMSDETVNKHLKELRPQDFWAEEEIDKAKAILNRIIC